MLVMRLTTASMPSVQLMPPARPDQDLSEYLPAAGTNAAVNWRDYGQVPLAAL
jgi:hypothetical protein